MKSCYAKDLNSFNTKSNFTLHNVCAVHQGVRSTSGVMSTVGDAMDTPGGYHKYSGGQGVFSTSGDIMSTHHIHHGKPPVYS